MILSFWRSLVDNHHQSLGCQSVQRESSKSLRFSTHKGCLMGVEFGLQKDFSQAKTFDSGSSPSKSCFEVHLSTCNIF